MPPQISLLPPSQDLLPGYAAALRTGWSPNNTRDVSVEHLAAIERDPDAFLHSQLRQDGMLDLGGGKMVPRLPGPIRWIWDGTFCGIINLRYQPGTLDLPPHVSGHVGYAVVPWKRRQGIATRALQLILPIASACGLPRVQVTCDADNPASRGVIERGGGVLSGTGPADHGGGAKLVFWIETG